ncbi:putative quinol monooxygenase [Paenibacillus sp. TY11]|uniref:putative quinol monooxygenase n=1 Tax=Paenibacillus sp. TY11 TaxID=3448633 RepID=UPI00403A59D6
MNERREIIENERYIDCSYSSSKTGERTATASIVGKICFIFRIDERCIKYILHQSIENNAVFVFYEIWKDEESINIHIQKDHYKQFLGNTEDLIESRQTHRLHEIN